MYASLLVALSLVLSPAPGVCRSAPAAATPARPPIVPVDQTKAPPPKPAREKLVANAALTIDTKAAGEEGELMQPRIRTNVLEAMKAFNIAEGQGAEIPQVTIKVAALEGDAFGWSYSVNVKHATTDPISGGSVNGECRDCTERQLVDRVGADARLAVQPRRVYIDVYNAKVDAENAANNNAAAGGGNGNGNVGIGTDTIEPPTGPSGQVDGSPMHPLCKAGIGLMAAGVVGIGVGVGLALMPDRQPDPNIGYELRSTQLPGYVTLGVGGAAALVGVALFVVGHRKSRSSQTALLPSFGAGHVGLQWSGRF